MTRCFKQKNYFYLSLLVYIIFQSYIFYIINKSEDDNGYNVAEIFETYKALGLKLNKATQFDATGKYKIFPLNPPGDKNLSFDVTLVSQCSENHIHFIENLIGAWSGPISVAVFHFGLNIEKTLWNLAKLLICQRDKKLSLQLVLPAQSVYIKDFKYESKMFQDPDEVESCQFFTEKTPSKNYDRGISYPVNLLRNVAKVSSSTDFIFVIDIDMTPSLNLRELFLKSIKGDSLREKVVYVVPTFEIEEKYKSPRTKRQLIDMVEMNVCRPFYFLPCPDCHSRTQYEKWMTHNKTNGIETLYDVIWKHPWEPFFIGRNNVPNFDERFQQYGMNRVSQICELHVAGYKFRVVDNAFLVHRGFKRKGDFHATKNAEMMRNRALYERFKQELKYRYPNSKEKC